VIALPRQGWLTGLVLALGVGTPPASNAQTPDPAPPPSIVWDSATKPGATAAVRVLDVPATIDAMKAAAEADPRWAAIFAVHVANADGSVPADRPAVLGSYRVVEGKTLRFTPRFPLDAARSYRATFDPDGPTGQAPPLVVLRPALSRPPTARTVVDRIEPTADRLPENLLKFYVYFNGAMGRGEAYSHLELVDGEGKALDHPFLELGEELWDPTNTRLTVLLDPGRIKRGLRPRKELGPIFEAGRSYTLKVDPAWRDANGQPLAGPASKTFRAGPADELSPNPRIWKIVPPKASTTEPLLIRFGDMLDRATVASGLTLVDPRGVEVPGTAEASLDGASWRFTPDRPWVGGTYDLIVNTDLEDLCGNSVRRPFEVDVQRNVPVVPEASTIRVPVAIPPGP